MTPADWHRFAVLLRLLREGKGVGPSFAELARAWHVSKGGVQRHLRCLEGAGLVRRLPDRRRFYEIAPYHQPCSSPAGAVLLPMRAVS